MKSRVLVLGAGFGGMELSTLLSEALGETADVTLIDKGDDFVVGAMNVAWAALIALYILAERLLPFGRSMDRALGAALAAWGAWLVWGLSGAPRPASAARSASSARSPAPPRSCPPAHRRRAAC